MSVLGEQSKTICISTILNILGMSNKFKLYIWPHHWDLPSLDADCLSCIFFLQLHFPGQYSLVECTDPDISPSGNFPFLEMDDGSGSPRKMTSARSILTHLERIKNENNGEGGLRGNGEDEERLGKAQRTAWSAFVGSKLKNIFVSGPLLHYSEAFQFFPFFPI